ncbi:MAG: endonuclease III [Bacteroidales bacterium]
MRKKERFERFISYFSENKPDADTELNYSTPFELLVAVILSAQCTDKRVNIITPKLFEKFPDSKALSFAKFEDVYDLIKSCTYPNNKTKHLIGMAKGIEHTFKGEVPSTIEELQTLPGVGRKTANVIASVIFNKPAMAVDTHVYRVSARIGLTNGAKTVLETEKQLVAHIPEELIPRAHHWLILHGRYICLARNPKCSECGLKDFCKFYARKEKRKLVKD